MRPEWKITESGPMGIFPMDFGYGDRKGTYEIHIVRRPQYCDRGDWMILVQGINDLDYSDGFPRYFIGTQDEVILQMEKWLDRRDAYLRHVLAH